MNTNFRKYFTIVIFIIMLLNSCDCWQDAKGIVADIESKQPLDSVTVKSYINKVSNKSFEEEMVTDSSGKFTGSTGLTGGGLQGCPDLVLVFSKSGYKTSIDPGSVNDTVFMERE